MDAQFFRDIGNACLSLAARIKSDSHTHATYIVDLASMRHLSFSEKLKALMLRDRLTQEQLSSACGISQPTVSRWWLGAEPSDQNLHMVAHFFEVDPELLKSPDA